MPHYLRRNLEKHHLHYNLEKQTFALKTLWENDGLDGPEFVGQGLSKHVGSDVYAYYIVSISQLKNKKPLIGIVNAHTECSDHGFACAELCSLPDGKTNPEECQPSFWITTYGKYDDGTPKWWYCNNIGDRKFKKERSNRILPFHTGKAVFNWNGASAYRDPSF